MRLSGTNLRLYSKLHNFIPKYTVMRQYSIFCLSIVLMATLAGCSKDDEGTTKLDPVEIKLNASQIVMVESSNNFAFDIFARVNQAENAGTNFMISPLSISYALSMTLNGAEGETLAAMKETLGMTDMSVDDINNSFSSLTDALLGVDDKVKINIANSVWVLEGFDVLPGFIQRLGDYYDAETKAFTISQESVNEINSWIEEETDGMIKEMIQQLSEDLRMLLINAICFEGEWYSGFDTENTADETFYKADDNEVEVPMMKQTEFFDLYVGDRGFKMVELPYGRGNYVMDIILPDYYKGLEDLISTITAEDFNRWVDQSTNQEVTVRLPRFKYEYEKQLKNILTDMGMGIAFSDMADFSNITETEPLCIGFVQHNSYIETEEKGTKAAAVTVVGIITMSYDPDAPPGPIPFNADRPFLYVIREVTTNTIVFMGKVEDPS